MNNFLNCFNAFTIIFPYRVNIAHKTGVIEKCGKGHTEIARNASLFIWSWYLYLCTQILSFFIRLDITQFHHINQHQIILTSQNTTVYYKTMTHSLFHNIKCEIALSDYFNDAFSITQSFSASCDFTLILCSLFPVPFIVRNPLLSPLS